jgi:hypothetical protein
MPCAAWAERDQRADRDGSELPGAWPGIARAGLMTAERYELYRVITDYEALQDGFLDRIDDLNTTLEQIDMAGGFTKGNVQKLLTKNPGKLRSDRPNTVSRRTFGWESLGKMLKGTGLALVLVVDDERFAETKEQLMQRKKPMRTNVSIAKPTWLFTKRNAANMRALGIKSLSPQQRRRIAKKAAKARWRKAKRQALNGAGA